MLWSVHGLSLLSVFIAVEFFELPARLKKIEGKVLLDTLKVTRRVAPRASNGGSTNYPIWFSQQQLEKWEVGELAEVTRASLFLKDG